MTLDGNSNLQEQVKKIRNWNNEALYIYIYIYI